MFQFLPFWSIVWVNAWSYYRDCVKFNSLTQKYEWHFSLFCILPNANYRKFCWKLRHVIKRFKGNFRELIDLNFRFSDFLRGVDRWKYLTSAQSFAFKVHRNKWRVKTFFRVIALCWIMKFGRDDKIFITTEPIHFSFKFLKHKGSIRFSVTFQFLRWVQSIYSQFARLSSVIFADNSSPFL